MKATCLENPIGGEFGNSVFCDPQLNRKTGVEFPQIDRHNDKTGLHEMPPMGFGVFPRYRRIQGFFRREDTLP